MPSLIRDQRKDALFFDALEGGANIYAAAKASGYSYGTVWNYREKFPDFAARWDEAKGVFLHKLEVEAIRRAVEGVPVAIYHNGAPVGTEMRYSDSLLKMLMAANDRKKYGNVTITHEGEIHHNVRRIERKIVDPAN